MADFYFLPYFINKKNLENKPIQKGQIFFEIEDKKIYVDYSDSERIELYPNNNEIGSTITNMEIRDDGYLVITLNDGNTLEAGPIIGQPGEKGEKGDKGDPFAISKVYTSIAEMQNNFETDDVPIGGFVVIETGNINDLDNAKLYVKGISQYEYLTDLSGAQGIQGPAGSQGEPGPKGDNGLPGNNGKSAYDTAKEGGYTGTEEQFANKLAEMPYEISVKEYGAKGDGLTNDTIAFQHALANNRVVYVPGGTYVLNDSLVIRQNCRLNFSQDTVLKFTQTSGNCIEMRSSATLNGNHGVISVPYAFSGNVVSSVTTNDTIRDTPPYTHWDPQWKRGRYIYDICIIKPDTNGLCYMKAGGTCTGNGIYLSCDGNSEVRFMWGVMMQGVRIAGAFKNGIQVINYDLESGPEDNAWNHDMRIEAIIESCETGINLTNCNGPHLAVTVQPHCAQDETTPYAKWGVRLEDCKFVDMSSSVVWDWNEKNSLIGTDRQYASVAMYGECSGLTLYDYAYYRTSVDIRDRVYSNQASNLERMIVVQEPITKWFKTINGIPYYFDGNTDKKLATEEELNTIFNVDMVQDFTNVLATATDIDGTIYNGIGYKVGYRLGTDGLATAGKDNTYTLTGFIPCTVGQKVYVEGMFLTSYDGVCRFCLYDINKNFIHFVSAENVLTNNYYIGGQITETGFWFSPKNVTENTNTAYVRFNVYTRMVGDFPVVAVDEEIKYTPMGFLTDSIKVDDNNIESTKLNTLQTRVNNIEQNVTDNIDKLTTEVNNKINNISITTEQVDFILPAKGENVQVPKFTNTISPFQEEKWINGSGVFTDLAANIYIEPKVFSYKDHITIRGINFTSNWSGGGYGRIWRHWKNTTTDHNAGDYASVINIASLINEAASGTGGSSYPDIRYDWDTSTSTLQIYLDQMDYTTHYLYSFGGPYAIGYDANSIIMTINEEIDYRTEWQGEPLRFDDTLYAQNMVLTSPSGNMFKLTVSDDGALTTTTFAK